jgi:hemerythrin
LEAVFADTAEEILDMTQEWLIVHILEQDRKFMS